MELKEALDNAWENIIDHPGTKKATKDVENHLEFKKELDDQVVNRSEGARIQTHGVSPDSYVSLTESDTDGSYPLSGSYDVGVDNIFDGDTIMSGYAGVTGGGTSDFVARSYYPDWSRLSGDVQFRIEGSAKGTLTAGVGDASAEVFIFVEDSVGIEKERIEDLGQYNDDFSGVASFTLDPNENYNIGVEFSGSASALGHYTYVDYWGTGFDLDDREVVVDDGRLEAYEI